MGKYYDVTAVMQVIGCVFNNPNLLDAEDKYTFYDEDFKDEFHQVVFGAIYNLHQLGAKEISLATIEDYLEQRPKKLAIYKLHQGEEYLRRLSENTQLAAFDFYYSRLKKMTLLRMYHNAGMDLTWLYDDDNILDAKKAQAQEEWLDNHSLEEIADVIDKKITDVRLKYAGNCDDDFIQAGDGAEALIDRLEKTPEVGYPLYGSLINTIHRGARLKKFYLRSAATGVGKALPNSTLVPTPDKFKLVSNVKVGDFLIDAFGKPTKVLGVYPQGKKQVWEITFEDGRKARCCEDHLWSFCTLDQDVKEISGRAFCTKSLKEVYNSWLFYTTLLVPLNKPVHHEAKVFTIEPYSLGTTLALEDCDQNFIPSRYFEGSVQQRFDLLNGILDRKGVVDEKEGGVSITLLSDPLKKCVRQLCYSLGLKIKNDTIAATPELFLDREKHKKICDIYFNKSDLEKAIDRFVSIVDIKKLKYEEEMTCFYVDNPEHLFLINDYIVTHNTRAMIADACYVACNQLYDDKQGEWIENGTREPTLFIATEQDEEEIQTMMLAFLSAVDEEHILTGEYLPGERERVVRAANVLSKSPLQLKKLPDFSLQDIENNIKYAIREFGVKYVFN